MSLQGVCVLAFFFFSLLAFNTPAALSSVSLHTRLAPASFPVSTTCHTHLASLPAQADLRCSVRPANSCARLCRRDLNSPCSQPELSGEGKGGCHQELSCLVPLSRLIIWLAVQRAPGESQPHVSLSHAPPSDTNLMVCDHRPADLTVSFSRIAGADQHC